MKRVTYHWVEMRMVDVPDECPTDSVQSMKDWVVFTNIETIESLGIYNQGITATIWPGEHDKYVIKKESRDMEIVEVQHMEEPECTG